MDADPSGLGLYVVWPRQQPIMASRTCRCQLCRSTARGPADTRRLLSKASGRCRQHSSNLEAACQVQLFQADAGYSLPDLATLSLTPCTICRARHHTQRPGRQHLIVQPSCSHVGPARGSCLEASPQLIIPPDPRPRYGHRGIRAWEPALTPGPIRACKAFAGACRALIGCHSIC